MIITVEKSKIIYHRNVDNDAINDAFDKKDYQMVIDLCRDDINTFLRISDSERELYDSNKVTIINGDKKVEGVFKDNEILWDEY